MLAANVLLPITDEEGLTLRTSMQQASCVLAQHSGKLPRPSVDYEPEVGVQMRSCRSALRSTAVSTRTVERQLSIIAKYQSDERS